MNELPPELKALEVDNRQGTVHVVGTDISPVEWKWQLTVRAATDSLARQAAEAASCQAQWEGDRLRLVVVLPDSGPRQSFQSDFEIRVPKTTVLRTQNRFGKTVISDLASDVEATGQNEAVEIRNIRGSVRAQTSFAVLRVGAIGPAWLRNQNGQIEAADVRGPLDGETSFASLDARDVGGPIRLRNQNGRIEVARAGDADLETSFASLSVTEITGDARLANRNGRVTASDVAGTLKAVTSFAAMDIEGSGPCFACQNQNGSIRLRVTSATVTNVEASTSFAPLEVRLPRGLTPAIQAQTRSGRVESDFPLLTQSAGPLLQSGAAPDRPRIHLQNQNGNIRIVRE